MVRPIADSGAILSAAASIDFTSIPATFAQLILVIYARTDSATATVDGVNVRFNNDSAANYDRQELTGSAATVSAAETFGATSLGGGIANGGASGANLFAVTIYDILHYAGAANNKAIDMRASSKSGTATTNLVARKASGFWRSSAAINRATLLPSTGNFAVGSRAVLYGMGGI